MTESAVNQRSIVDVDVSSSVGPGESAEGAAGARLKVLHVLAVSMPHLNGYTVRSKCILSHQQAGTRVEPVVVTSPFYPGNEASVRDERIDGIRHVRIQHPTDMTRGGTFSDRLCAALFQLRKRGRTWWRLFRRLLRMPFRYGWIFLWRVRSLLRRSFFRATKLLPIRSRYWMRSRVWRIRSYLRRRRKQGPGQAGRLGRLVHGALSAIAWPFMMLARGIGALKRIIGQLVVHGSYAIEGVEEAILLRRFERGIVQLAREIKPDVIHAHSPYRCGIPAAKAAGTLGIPCVYEVRGFWEDSGVAGGRFSVTSTKYRFWRAKETQAMRAADAIVCICEQLKREIVKRGVEASRIFITPNAVDAEQFQGLPSGAEDDPSSSPEIQCVKDRLRGCVLGYVGSLRMLEGVDELVRGVAELHRRGMDVSLLVVGGGPDLEMLEELASQLGLEGRAVFTDRVPHDLVAEYYRLIDVFAITRPDTRVTRIVTPLKPLEAMALGRPLVLSDLPALREMGVEGETSLYYTPGDVGHFADVCTGLVRDRLQRLLLGENARRWVLAHRTWESSLASLPAAYECARRNLNAMSGAD